MSYRKIAIIGSLGIHLLFGFLILNLGLKSRKRRDIFVVNLVRIQGNLEKNKFKVKENNRTGIENIENKEENMMEIKDNFEHYERINTQENQNLEKIKEKTEEKSVDNSEIQEKEGVYNISDSKISKKEAIYMVETQTKSSSEIISKEEGYRKERNGEINKVDLNENEDFFYYKIVKEKIIKKIVYPEIARRRNIEGNVKIGFIVLRNGELEEIKVIKSSKYEILDKNSIDIIKSAFPFPKFPDTLNYEKILFVMDFNYKLK